MRFEKVEDSSNYLYRFESENGRWEMGLIPQLFASFAVGFSPIDAEGPTISYATGDDVVFAFAVFGAVRKILERYPENVSESQLRKEFPEWNARPINKDGCWRKLRQMAVGQEGSMNFSHTTRRDSQ